MLIMIFEDNHNHVGRIPSLDENIEDKEVGGVKQILDLASSHTHAHAHAFLHVFLCQGYPAGDDTKMCACVGERRGGEGSGGLG